MAKDQLIYGLRPILQALQDNQTLGNVFLQKGIGGALYTQLEGELRSAGIAPKYVPVEKLNRLGDVRQIDTPYLDEQSNGLSYLVDKVKGHDMYAHITLEKGERSALANLANDLL